MGVSARDLRQHVVKCWTWSFPTVTLYIIYTYHTWQQSYSLYACLSAGVRSCVKNYPPEMMQPSSSTSATIVSAKNQNDATIVKDKFFFCHYYIVWESNNAGDARGQSWNESLKSIWNPGGSRLHRSNTAPRSVLVARATKISNAQKQPLRQETSFVTTWNT